MTPSLTTASNYYNKDLQTMNPQEDSVHYAADYLSKDHRNIKVFVPLDLKRPPHKKKAGMFENQSKVKEERLESNAQQNKLEVYGSLQLKVKSDNRLPLRTSSNKGTIGRTIFL